MYQNITNVLHQGLKVSFPNRFPPKRVNYERTVIWSSKKRCKVIHFRWDSGFKTRHHWHKEVLVGSFQARIQDHHWMVPSQMALGPSLYHLYFPWAILASNTLRKIFQLFPRHFSLCSRVSTALGFRLYFCSRKKYFQRKVGPLNELTSLSPLRKAFDLMASFILVEKVSYEDLHFETLLRSNKGTISISTFQQGIHSQRKGPFSSPADSLKSIGPSFEYYKRAIKKVFLSPMTWHGLKKWIITP